jgi:oxaloacetate decarboxylase alpha subunit
MAKALAGLGLGTGVDVDALWKASELVDEHIGDEPVTPLAPRIAVRAAEHRTPSGLVAALDAHLRANAAGDRLDEVLDELARIREEVGWPPLAAPIGQILGSQALLHVLSASRYQTVIDELRGLIEGRFGNPPGPIDPAVRRAVQLTAGDEPEEEALDLDEVRERSGGLAASEEELLLLALFGEEAEPLLNAIRGRAQRDESLSAGGVDQRSAERIREIVRIVQESGVGEITIEDEGLRVTVRRTPEPLQPALGAPGSEADDGIVQPQLGPPQTDGFVRVEAPMVGVFYRAPQPGAPPFVEEGDTVAAGQTLCILEAMKLMNEIKAEAAGIVRQIHVGNAEPVEFGQLLFELEPVVAPPAV